MPIVMYKRTTAATALTTATNWDSVGPGGTGATGVVPNAGYTAQWDTVSGSTSGGGTQTGAITPDGIVINASSAAMTLSGAITVGADGITMGPNYGFNSDALTLSGGLTVNTAQTWTLNNVSNINTGGFDALRISGLFAGSGNINVVRQAGGANQYASVGSTNTTATYSGTVTVNDNVWIGWPTANGNTWGTTSTIRFAGTGAGSNVYWASGITIPVGVTFKVDGNVMFGVPTAAGRTLTIAGPVQFGAVNRNFGVDNNTGAPKQTLTLSGTLTGTAGFTKSAGAGFLYLSGNLAGLTGTINQNQTTSGMLIIQAGALGTVVGGTTFNVTGPASYGNDRVLLLFPNVGTLTLPASVAFTGDGAVAIEPGAAVTGIGYSFPAGALAGLSGTTVPALAGSFVAPTAGLFTTTNSSQLTNIVTAKDLPSVYSFWAYANVAGNSHNHNLYYTSTAASHNYATRLDLVTGLALSGTFNASLYANQTSGALVLSGGVQRYEQSGTRTFTLTLRGTTLGVENTISGNITQTNATLTGGVIAIAKADANTWVISGTNDFTGGVTHSDGILSARSNTAFGSSTSGTYTQTGGTLDISGGVNLNKGALGFTLVLAGAATQNLSSTTGANTLTCGAITLNSTLVANVASGASLTLANSGVMSGAFGITTNGLGELALGTTANTLTGAITIGAGSTLTASNLQNSGVASSIGTGALSSAIVLLGTLKYAGAGHSTNRSITFTGADCRLDSSGAGAVTYSAATYTAAARSITFTGSNTAANTFSASITDGGAFATGLAKSGVGKWVLSGAISTTGAVTCQNGTWNFGGINRSFPGSLAVSGGTVENGTATIAANTTMNGGTITAELTGANTLTVGAGSDSTLNPTNGGNTLSGAAAVNAGAVLKLVTSVSPATAGAGKVLGNAPTTVTGTIRTGAAGSQRGQMRYGGNLTFAAGAVLHIGGA